MDEFFAEVHKEYRLWNEDYSYYLADMKCYPLFKAVMASKFDVLTAIANDRVDYLCEKFGKELIYEEIMKLRLKSN